MQKIPKEKNESLDFLQKITTKNRSAYGWDSPITIASFKNLYEAEYYPQWNYLNELDTIKFALNRIIEAEIYSQEFREMLSKHAYFEKYKNNRYAIQLYLAIQGNAKYTNFMALMFGRSTIQPNVFNSDDYGRFGLQLDGSRELIDEYMLCKIARSIDN